MVIDASFGLGEAIVSGQVDPDHYVVDPQNWEITGRKLGSKEIAIVPTAGGGTERIEREDAAVQALPDAQIIALAQMAQRVAEHFGVPQDIEWAWAGGQLYLLQARPITSLYPLPAQPRQAEGPRVYVSFNSIQGVTDPFTPLGIDAAALNIRRRARVAASPADHGRDHARRRRPPVPGFLGPDGRPALAESRALISRAHRPRRTCHAAPPDRRAILCVPPCAHAATAPLPCSGASCHSSVV